MKSTQSELHTEHGITINTDVQDKWLYTFTKTQVFFL